MDEMLKNKALAEQPWQRYRVKDGDKGVTFSVRLKAGRTQLQTSFLDASGAELCGAYYTEVRRK